MASKKEKITKFVHGYNIINMNFNRSWITCTIDNGEKVTISAKMIYNLLDQFDLFVESYSDHFRTVAFESNEKFGKIDYKEE